MRYALVLVAACSSSHPAGPDAALFEIPAFTPLLCTAGSPGEPTCPINHVDATILQLSFTAQPIHSELYIPDLTFSFDSDPHLRHPRFVASGTPDATDQLADIVVHNGPIGRAVTLDAGFIGSSISITFERR